MVSVNCGVCDRHKLAGDDGAQLSARGGMANALYQLVSTDLHASVPAVVTSALYFELPYCRTLHCYFRERLTRQKRSTKQSLRAKKSFLVPSGSAF